MTITQAISSRRFLSIAYLVLYYALNPFMVCLPRTPKSLKFELRKCYKCSQHLLLDAILPPEIIELLWNAGNCREPKCTIYTWKI